MGARILVIEDNPANLDLMIYLLGAFGHEPLGAADGREGLAVARTMMPDLIICDVQLPAIDGYEVVRQLKADPLLRAIPVVAVTAFAMPGDREKALMAGFNGYIAKPIAPETILAQLNAFLPLAKRSTAPPSMPPSVAAPRTTQNRGTILVVDDSRINGELIRSTVEPVGYRAILAENLASAVALTSRERIDLVLSDLHMPDGDGYEVIRAIRSNLRNRDTPILIISSTSSGLIDQAALASLGAAGLILRPIEPDALIAKVEACLSMSGTEN